MIGLTGLGKGGASRSAPGEHAFVDLVELGCAFGGLPQGSPQGAGHLQFLGDEQQERLDFRRFQRDAADVMDGRFFGEGGGRRHRFTPRKGRAALTARTIGSALGASRSARESKSRSWVRRAPQASSNTTVE